MITYPRIKFECEVDGKDLVENLAAGQRVVHDELDLIRWWQAVGNVDVQNQLGECRTICELQGDVRIRGVARAAHEYGLAAADAEVAAARGRGEVDDMTRAGTVEITLDDEARVNEVWVIE